MNVMILVCALFGPIAIVAFAAAFFLFARIAKGRGAQTGCPKPSFFSGLRPPPERRHVNNG